MESTTSFNEWDLVLPRRNNPPRLATSPTLNLGSCFNILSALDAFEVPVESARNQANHTSSFAMLMSNTTTTKRNPSFTSLNTSGPPIRNANTGGKRVMKKAPPLSSSSHSTDSAPAKFRNGQLYCLYRCKVFYDCHRYDGP